jgi:hypothetical protein
MSKIDTKPVSRKADIVVQELGNEVLIYDLKIHKAFSLNETSALVWQACNGNRTINEISAQISAQLNSPVNEEFVWLALEQLKKENLIENEAEVSAPFEGMSRREVIRKVALTSLIALPIVSSLVAPMAVHAQSGVCAAGSCRCPNATPSTGNCQGSSTPTTVNCNTVGASAACDCVGPFGVTDSAGPGFKTGLGCRRTA